MNISVYAPWREYRARIFKIQSRECVSAAWKERAIQRKANSQTPAILNVARVHSGGARHFLNYSIFPPGHFARLFLIHRRNIPPSPRHGPRIFPRNFTVATLQQHCMPNKHPRLTSPSRIYVPRIPRREESAVEEASVAGLPLTIVVKINSLLPSSHTIENLCPRLSFLNC